MDLLTQMFLEKVHFRIPIRKFNADGGLDVYNLISTYMTNEVKKHWEFLPFYQTSTLSPDLFSLLIPLFLFITSSSKSSRT